MKRIYILAMAVVLLFCSCAREMELPDTAEKIDLPQSAGAVVIENEQVLLSVGENGFVTITDKASGSVYTSTPENADEDESAQGINKSKLKSEYYLTLVNSKGETVEINSFDGSVSKNAVSIEKTDDAIKVWYHYPEHNVMHSVKYTLCDKGFEASVEFDSFTEQFGKISENDWGFMKISMLPYFAASGIESDGYMVVPDGSGAIINHNNKKSSYAVYAQDVYGRDSALSTESKTMDTKTVRFPVFGNVEGTKGYVALITDGAPEATIYAETSGSVSSYNNVYSGFSVRKSDGVAQTVSNGYGGDSTLRRVAVSTYVPEGGKISVRYMLVNKENLSYVDLAKEYRNYLIDNGVEERVENAPLYISFTGGISDTVYTLGIPHKTVVPVTDFERATEIITDLKGNGVDNIAVRYTGWQKGGKDTKIPKSFDKEGKIGGNKAFDALVKCGADVFPEIDLVNFYKGGNGYNLQSDCVLSLSGSAAYVYEYAVNTGAKTEKVPSRLLTPTAAQEAYDKLECGFENVSFGPMGTTLFSEFSTKRPMTRSESAELYSSLIEKSEGKVMVEGGNSYTLKGASHIYALDCEATGYDLEDGSIPFYQIALHSLVSYSVPPINLTADANRAMLKALETGSSLCYSVCGGDVENIDESISDAPYEYIRELMIEQNKKAMPILEKVSELEITNHEKSGENLYMTAFEDGSVIYVNYSSQDATVDGRIIPAEGFLFEEGRR